MMAERARLPRQRAEHHRVAGRVVVRGGQIEGDQIVALRALLPLVIETRETS